MHSKHTLKIRLGAAHDTVEVAGLVFDRSKMTGAEKAKLREQVVLGLMDHGQLPKNSRRLPFKVREELDRRREEKTKKGYARGRRAKAMKQPVAA